MTTALRYAGGDGTSLAARASGAGGSDGPHVLLLSGGPGCVNYLPDAADDFPARVVAPDPRGVGASAGGPHDVRQSLDDLEALRDHLGVSHWVVVGHSWGADLGLAYAAVHPGAVAHLVSVCGTGLQDDRSWHAAWAARRREEPDLAIEHDPAVHRALLDSWREWVRAPELYDWIRRIGCDVDVVAAELDIRPSWPLAQLAVLFKTPLRVLPGVAHDVWHERPDLWWSLVGDVVRARQPRPPAPTAAEEDARVLEERREHLLGLLRAAADPRTLVDAVASAGDLDDLEARLRTHLDLTPLQANAVMNLGIWRLSPSGRELLQRELDELDGLD